MSAAKKRVWRRLCVALAFNFPAILYRPAGDDKLRPYSRVVQQHHDWTLGEGRTVTHKDATIQTNVGQWERAQDLDAVATSQLRNKETVVFMAHPRVSRFMQLQPGDSRLRHKRKRYKQHLGARRRGIGEIARNARAAASGTSSRTMGSVDIGLAQWRWKQAMRVYGISEHERQLLVRLKANKISKWNPRDHGTTCPHDSCCHEALATVTHVSWECPHAKPLWSRLIEAWESAGLPHDSIKPADFFSLAMPATPAKPWGRMQGEHAADERDVTLLDELHSAAQMVCAHLSASVIGCIWRHMLPALNGEEASIAQVAHWRDEIGRWTTAGSTSGRADGWKAVALAACRSHPVLHEPRSPAPERFDGAARTDTTRSLHPLLRRWFEREPGPWRIGLRCRPGGRARSRCGSEVGGEHGIRQPRHYEQCGRVHGSVT